MSNIFGALLEQLANESVWIDGVPIEALDPLAILELIEEIDDDELRMEALTAISESRH